VIDPLGRMVSSLPWYEEGILKAEVWMMDE